MLKKTKTRETILSLFNSAESPLTAGEIFEKLKNDNITLSSIYRTLDTFSKENILIKDSDPTGTAIYSLQRDDHSHYLECKNCHEKIKLHFCPYHKINKQISAKYNFQVDEHNLVIYGLCDKCTNLSRSNK